MFFRASPVMLLSLFLTMACGRPPLREATLKVSVIREGRTVKNVWVALEDERYPCGRLDATVTLNGVPLRVQTDGTKDRGWYLISPMPGCNPPSFELSPETDPRIMGQPFELVVDAGGERVVLRSEALLTAGLTGPAEVAAGGALRLTPNGEFSWAGVFIALDVSHPRLVRDDTDSREVAAQKRSWNSWPMTGDSESVMATVPATLPAGDYQWRVGGLSLQVPQQQCEGVVRCEARLMLDEVGTVSVRR